MSCVTSVDGIIKVGSCYVRVGSDVQTDAITPSNTQQHATGCANGRNKRFNEALVFERAKVKPQLNLLERAQGYLL